MVSIPLVTVIVGVVLFIVSIICYFAMRHHEKHNPLIYMGVGFSIVIVTVGIVLYAYHKNKDKIHKSIITSNEDEMESTTNIN